MPPKGQKEAPLTPQLTDRLNDLTARHLSTDDDGEKATSLDEWKALGNACFSNGSYLTAIKCYTKAIADIEGGDTAVLRSNRSAAYLKSSMFSGPALALKDAERAVELEPAWFKGHLRVGDAQFARKKYEEAEAAYERALSCDPSCTTATASLKELRKEKFLRDLDVQEKERRKAEEEEIERLKERGEYNEVFARTESEAEPWTAANVNATLHTTYRASEAQESPEKPFEFHNAPIRFGHEDEEDGEGISGLGWATGIPRGTRRPPTEDETEQLIRTWKRDLVPREEDQAQDDTPDRSTPQQEQQRHSGAAMASGSADLTSAPSPPTARPLSSARRGAPSSVTTSSTMATSSPATPGTMVTASTGEGSNGAGIAYKQRLLGQFRHKVEADKDFEQTLQARRAEELRRGEAVDYREADRYRTVYAKSTNGIGLGISTDAYKEFTGMDRSRW